MPENPVLAFLRHPVLLAFSLLTLVYNFVYAQMNFTLALQLVDLFGTGGPGTFGLVWAVNAVTVVALTPVVLRLTRSWTNLASMAAGMAFFTLGVGVFLFRPGLPLVIGSTLLWTVGEVLFSIHVGDLVSAQSPPALRGRFQGYVQFLGSLGFVASPLVSGLTAQVLGLPGVWMLCAAAVAAVGAGYLVLGRRVSRVPAAAGP